MFIRSIRFNSDVEFESGRPDQKHKFKVKTHRYTRENKRKPIYETGSRFGPGRTLGYEKEKVVERTFVIFPKDLQVDFRPVTVIVGDNGCGKSSLVKYLKPPKFDEMSLAFRTHGDKTREQVIKEDIDKWMNNKLVKLTFDKLPTHIILEQQIHKNSFASNLAGSKMTLSGQEMLNLFKIQENSNGENTLDFIHSLMEVENMLIVLDEPETSLSIKSQIKVAKQIKKLAKRNQVIIITHSPELMYIAKEVYDFEAKAYVNTQLYIDKQRWGI